MFAVALIAGVILSGPPGSVRAANPTPDRYPADLGPATVDVTTYPADLRQTYTRVFLPKCGSCHSPARPINSPFLELPAPERDALAKRRPDAVSDPQILDVRVNIWRSYVYRMGKRPPSRNLCPDLERDELQAVWHFLVYDSRVRKTGPALDTWIAHRKELIRRFKETKGGKPVR